MIPASPVVRPKRARRTPRRRCYIHVGTHKTGTTSLQCFLTGNRERFADHGVIFPLAGCDEDATIAHHQLARELMGLPSFDAARGGLAAVADELRRSDAGTACLTSELFSFLYDAPDALVRLRDAIEGAGFTARIVAYLRPQASYCSALYAENVRQGYRAPFASYFADVLRHGSYIWNERHGPPLDYHKLLDGFAAVFGREAIVARRYRGQASCGRLMASFVRVLLPAGPAPRTFDFPQKRYNGSLKFSEILRIFGSDLVIAPHLRFAPLTLAQLGMLGARFAPSNALLAQRYGLLLPVFERGDLKLAAPFTSRYSEAHAAGRARDELKAARPAMEPIRLSGP